MSDFDSAVTYFKEKLPGWWYTVGECSVSCDATVGPDVAYCPKWMLVAFDDGLDCDLYQPSTISQALIGATDIAVEALKIHKTDKRIGMVR